MPRADPRAHLTPLGALCHADVGSHGGTARGPDCAASLLNWFERVIRRRRESPEIGFGTLTLLDVDAPSVLAQALERYAARWFRVRRDGQRLPP